MSVANGRTLGANEHQLRATQRASIHHGHDPQSLLSRQVIRENIEGGMCSWCDRGPFRSLASHTNKMHGIDRRELRALAGLTMRQPVASEAFREKCRERAVKEGTGYSDAARAGLEKARGASRKYTEAGLARIARTASATMAAMTPEERSRRASIASNSRTPEGLIRTAEAASKRERSESECKAFGERMRRPDVVAKRAAARVLQGCGTVASYKRGCRCDQCRRAKAESRRKGE